MNTQSIRDRFQKVITRHAPSDAAKRWRLSRFERGLRVASEIESRIGSLRGLRVLDVGAANGGDIAAMFAHGARCVGADKFDHDYNELTNEVGQGSPDFRFARFDALSTWPIQSQSFDVVISLGLLECVEDLDRFFAELSRVLVPTGIAILYTGTALRMVRRDPLYKLPMISLLPARLRKLVAEKVFNRTYRFPVSSHTFYSAGTIRKHAVKAGLSVRPEKYAQSQLMNQIKGWPMGSKIQDLVRHLAFDMVVVTSESRPDREPSLCHSTQPIGP